MSSNEIEIQASEWLARLDMGEATPQLRAAVAAWRAADARHEVAFLRIKAGWDRLDRLQALRPSLAQGIDPDLIRLNAVSAGSAAPWLSSRRRMLSVAATIVLAIAAGWSATVFVPRDPVYVTGIGGFERAQLTDGSIVELNTDTEIRAAFDRTLRKVELLNGEAHFTVARDITRPFVVTAGDTTVRAVGTVFNIRRHANSRVEIVVTEGSVAVGQPSVLSAARAGHGSLSATQLLSAGQAASVVQGQMQVREVPRVEAERKLAWQSGMLLFEGDALTDVIDEFNRYNRSQLQLADPALAPLKIGGYFKPTNLDAFVSVLQHDFGIEVTVEGDRILLRRARAEK